MGSNIIDLRQQTNVEMVVERLFDLLGAHLIQAGGRVTSEQLHQESLAD